MADQDKEAKDILPEEENVEETDPVPPSILETARLTPPILDTSHVSPSPVPETETVEKKVTIVGPPEVFEIIPGSTKLQRVEPPPPPPSAHDTSQLPTTIPQQDLDKIISETLDVVECLQKQSNEQKLANHRMAFMLSRIMNSLDLYADHVERLNMFLVNNDLLQSQWYYKYCQELPPYNDYFSVLKDSSEKIKVEDVPCAISEAILRKLVDDVVNNFYAGGAHVRSQRIMCKNIFAKIHDRRQFICDQKGPFSTWFFLMNKAIDNQNTIGDMLFKVSANVSFLKTGETSEPLSWDINKALDTSTSV